MGATSQETGSPSVSVVMPARNAEAFVGQALACLEAQTFEDFEVIVVDDGSTDGTAQVVGQATSRDARFRLLRRPAAGAGPARNAGIDVACGAYLLFLDADDLFEPTLIATLHGLAHAARADVAICAADRFLDDPARPVRRWDAGRFELAPGTYEAGQLASRLYQCTTVVVWNKLFDARLVKQSGLRFQNLPRFNDAAFTLQALGGAKRIVKANEVLVHYRVQHGASISDSAHLHPLCDLQAFEEARKGLARRGLLDDPLKASLDAAAASTVIWRLMQFARTDAQATRQLHEAYFNDFAPAWGLLDALPRALPRRYAVEHELIRRAGVAGLLWASAGDARDRASARSGAAELRLMARLAASAWLGAGR